MPTDDNISDGDDALRYALDPGYWDLDNCIVLDELAHDERLSVLIKGLTNKSSRIREEAILGLSRLGGPNSIPHLEAARRNEPYKFLRRYMDKVIERLATVKQNQEDSKMSKPYRISSDPYAGEVMSIHKEDDGTFYVEIPELGFSSGGFRTPRLALECGLGWVDVMLRNSGIPTERRRSIEKQITQSRGAIQGAQEIIQRHEGHISDLKEQLREEGSEISEGLRELPEDRPRLEAGVNFLAEDSPIPCKAVGFRLHKDVDRDGDMDHAFVLWSRHKKLVR